MRTISSAKLSNYFMVQNVGFVRLFLLARSMGRGKIWSDIIGTINQLHDNDIIPHNVVQKVIGNGNSTLFWKILFDGSFSLTLCSIDGEDMFY